MPTQYQVVPTSVRRSGPPDDDCRPRAPAHAMCPCIPPTARPPAALTCIWSPSPVPRRGGALSHGPALRGTLWAAQASHTGPPPPRTPIALCPLPRPRPMPPPPLFMPQQVEIFNRVLSDFGRSKSYWHRQTFVACCLRCLEHFSRKFFREKMIETTLELCKVCVVCVCGGGGLLELCAWGPCACALGILPEGGGNLVWRNVAQPNGATVCRGILGEKPFAWVSWWFSLR